MSKITPWVRTLGQVFGLEMRGVDAPIHPSDVFGKALDLFGGGTVSKTGLSVTTDTALEVSTVYACVRVLTESVSTLPLDQMVRRDGVPRPSRPRAEWLDFQMGPYDKIQILGQIMTSLLTDGNAYVATVRDDMGLILWLEVLDPTKVTPKKLSDGTIVYEINLLSGSRTVSQDDIKHITGMMLPGRLEGMSPIGYAKETIGLSRAATEFGAGFFGNGATPGSTIEVPGELSPTAASVIKDTWEASHRGVANSGRIAVLTEGAKYAKVTMSPDESQFLQTRQFQVNDIARFYGVPLHLLAAEGPQFGDTTSAQNMAFVQHSLRPWIERIELALTDLLATETPMRPRGAFVRLNVDGLLRGNMAERFNVWSLAVTQGILTINEVRREEGRPPVEWGDEPISVQVQDDEPDTEDTEPAPPPGLPTPDEEQAQ